MSRTLKYALLIAAVALLAWVPLAMQSDTGKIHGAITDEHGPVVKASLEIRNVMSGMVLHAQSDATGQYRLESVPQGRYSFWVQAPAHDSVWIREVIVEQGRTTRRDIRLGSSPSDPLPTGE